MAANTTSSPVANSPEAASLLRIARDHGLTPRDLAKATKTETRTRTVAIPDRIIADHAALVISAGYRTKGMRHG